MTKHHTAADMSNFEAAPIRDGQRLEVVHRRRGAAILARLPRHARQAVEVYTATAEAVAAGGASNPRDSLAATGPSSGGVNREGPQAAALDQAAFLRRLEAAVAREPVTVGRRPAVKVPALLLWRAVCLQDVSFERFLSDTLGAKPAKSRMADLSAGFMAAADRVADAIGAARSPW